MLYIYVFFAPQRCTNACHYAIALRTSSLISRVHCTFKCRPVCAASSRLANELWRIVGNYIGKPAPTTASRRHSLLPLSATLTLTITTATTAATLHFLTTTTCGSFACNIAIRSLCVCVCVCNAVQLHVVLLFNFTFFYADFASYIFALFQLTSFVRSFVHSIQLEFVLLACSLACNFIIICMCMLVHLLFISIFSRKSRLDVSALTCKFIILPYNHPDPVFWLPARRRPFLFA